MAEIVKNTTTAMCHLNQKLCTTNRWQGIHTALTTNERAAKGYMLFQQNAGEGSKIEGSGATFDAGTAIKVPVTRYAGLMCSTDLSSVQLNVQH
jgi:hypothetical protein